MRKLIGIEFLTLDGVIQTPGGSEEDTMEGFEYGGWMGPYMDDILGSIMNKQMSGRSDLLHGRITYEIFGGYWPQHADDWLGINQVKKYIVSHDASLKLDWENYEQDHRSIFCYMLCERQASTAGVCPQAACRTVRVMRPALAP